MKYNTIIFDIGFTLIVFDNFTLNRYFDTLNKGLEALINWLMEEKILKEPEKFRKTFKRIRNQNFAQALRSYEETTTETTLLQTLESLNLPQLDTKRVQKAALLYHATEGAFWKVRSTAKSVLEELRRQSFKLGILSNAPYHQGILLFLKNNNIAQYFDAISTSAEIGFCKPDKRAFEYILKKLASEPTQSVMVGDDLSNDINGAQQLGMKTIYVKKDFIFPQNTPTNVIPDSSVSDLPEILPILRGWNNS
jgi:putative hydrolase of the HAD superfamily